MEKKTIFKLCVSAVILILAVVFASGIIGGKQVTYQVPGPYTAESTNQFSTVKVDMIIEGDRITDCVITSSGDSDLMTDDIRSEWAQAIVDAQSADADAITGATLTYSAASVQEAVNDILVQAGLREPGAAAEAEPAESAAEPTDEAETAEAGAYADGTYTAQSVNDFSTVDVEMTIEGGKIADCSIASSGDSDLMTDDIRSEWA
ncbi:MAG: FMN-binding protein, partial [Clostridia bacterium]|nr:FMN-binding protein [Clostridia bacterium]